MGVRYTIHRANKFVAVRFFDRITTQENFESFQKCIDDPDHAIDQHFLIDFQDVTDFAIDFSQMMRMVSRLAPLYELRAPNSRTSIYAPGDTGFGVARMYQSLGDGQLRSDMTIHRALTDALAELDVPAMPRDQLHDDL